MKKHTNLGDEIHAYYSDAPLWQRVAIYTLLVLFSIGVTVAVAGAIYGQETVVYWLADVIS